MPSELQTLDTIFNSRVFRIPDYQRGYAWGERELKAFWQDLDRLGSDQKHYTGQLTVEQVPNQGWKAWDEDRWLIEGKNYKPFYVVDGQQRLTTAIILVKCLLDCVSDDTMLTFTDKPDHIKKYLLQASTVSRSYLFGYERDNPSYEYLKTQILGQPSNQYQGTETTYTANLCGARDFFRARLKGALLENIERWFKALTQRFMFGWYEVEGDLDVFIVFETMNNRGKPLSRLELLKNRLIYLSTLVPNPATDSDRQALRRNVNDAWKTAYEFLGRSKDRVLDDDEFLRAHWTMYFTYARDDAGQFASFLLDRHFTSERVDAGVLTAGELQHYATSVQESVKAWYSINFPADAAGLAPEVKLWLERLDRVGRGAFGPLVMAALQKNATSAALVSLLMAAERFVFVVGRLCQRRADTGDSEFYRLAGEVFRGEKSLSDATKAIREKTSIYFSREKMITDMREEREGFYSWGGIRYFLFEYEQELKRLAGMNTEKISWQSFAASKKDHVTIEHIYPRTPKAGEWPTFDARDETERRALLHSLGNLLALSASRNSTFSNRSFVDKRQDADCGYSKGSYSEIAVAQETNWTPQMILSRGLTMLLYLETRWQISLGSRAEKLRLLRVEFLEPATPQP
ncbi:DUF262 domain-containing protein [Sorangium sp. So ce1153]|uniref:DUF262 domain-containing protein n=1 Tax=Sorangium sp. So ce1153 TaxID=3133333 RepID=UPI003F62D50B